jgi:MFS family permease
VLVAVDFLDELSAGVPMIGAPEIRSELALGYGLVAMILLVLPQAASLVIEPPLFVLSDRVGKRRLVLAGHVLLGACFVVAGLARDPILFIAAYVLITPASGLGVGLAQVALLDAHPARLRDRLMTRWTMMGAIGDAAAPVFLGAVALAGGDFRTAFVVVGLLFVVHAALLSRARWRERSRAEACEEPFLDLIRSALSNSSVWIWSTGVSLCGLLDETFVAFGALYLRDALGASPLAIDVVMAAFAIGGIAGLHVAERLLRRARPLHVLAAAAIGTLAGYAGWMFAASIPAAAAAALAVGACASPLYPIAQARAYEAMPGRTGTAAAVGELFAPVHIGLPLLIGWLADAHSLWIALWVLALQPLGLLAIAAGRTRHW